MSFDHDTGQIIDDAPEARLLPAAAGWRWLTEAMAMLREHLGLWVLLALIFLLLRLALNKLGLGLLDALLTPLLTAGLMLACAEQQRGEEIEIGHLFAGFQHRWQELLKLGLFSLLGMLAIAVGVATLMLLNGLAPLLEQIIGASKGPLSPGQVLALVEAGGVGSLLLISLLALLGFSLWGLALWFSPALVMLDDIAAWEALKLSLVASLRNWRAVLVYSLALLALALLAALPLFLGFFLLLPLVLISSYTAYRQLFPVKATALPPAL